eukprot:8491191-Ditylum_brightwellii.AAC.1
MESYDDATPAIKDQVDCEEDTVEPTDNTALEEELMDYIKAEEEHPKETSKSVAAQIKNRGENVGKEEGGHKTSLCFKWIIWNGMHTFNVQTALTKSVNVMKTVDPTQYLQGIDDKVWNTPEEYPLDQ